MKPHFVRYQSAALLYALFFAVSALGQVCNGSVGDPLVHVDFGSGTGFGPALPAGTTTLLGYQPLTCPTDGGYNIMSSTPACWGGDWHAVTSDHTGNPNGYFMMVNAAIAPSEFYVRNINGLCPDTTYEISFSILNIHKFGILPNITVIVETLAGSQISSYTTGPIPLSATPTWNTYSMVTNIGTNTGVRFRLRNNAPGGIGNDLALDDIIFRPIGPAIGLDIVGFPGGVANITTTDMGNLEIGATVGPCYTSNLYQWQVSTDSGTTWTDIAAATNNVYFRPPTGTGTYLYRLVVSPAASGGNINCSVNSNPVTVNVAGPPACPAPLLNTLQSCTNIPDINITSPLGANYTYSINGVNYQTSPSFTDVANGTYNVTYQDSNSGCTSLPNQVVIAASTTPVAPVVTTPVFYCQGSTAAPLVATALAGHTLNWYGTNATGGTASPTAPTPSTAATGSTTYYVAQTNGTCESPRAAIVVNVSAPASPQGQTNPFCLSSTPTSVTFDWSNVTGYLGYYYSYSIGGGPVQYGFKHSPSNITFGDNGAVDSDPAVDPPLAPGTNVTFTILSVLGVPCAPSQTVTSCHTDCATMTTTTFSIAQTSFCKDAAAPALPTTSSNGITGTWSPAAISTATVGTVNYVFTPNAVLFPCATPFTQAITINANVTPTFSIPTAPICQGATFSLPTSSTNTPPVTGTWSPALNTAVLSNNVTYTFTPTPGQCISTTSGSVQVTLSVIANVTPNFPSTISLCSGNAAPLLANTSPNGITGTWSPATINNTAVGTTPYTFTPGPNQCAQPQTINVTVLPRLQPNFAPIADICQNGTAPLLVNTSPTGVAGTWAPSSINTTVAGTVNYVFTPNASQCADPQTLQVTITPRVTPTFAPIAPVCQGSAAPVLPTSSNNVPPITGTWSPAVSTGTVGTQTYTFTPTPGQCVTAGPFTTNITVVQPVMTNFALVPPFCAGTTAPTLPTTSPNGIDGTWSPATVSNTVTQTYTFTPNANQCAVAQPPITITVIQPTVPNFPSIAPFCVGETAPVLNPTSPNGVTGTWNPATVDNTQNGTYLFTPDAGQCATTQPLNVVVNQPTFPNFTDLAFCNGEVAPVLSTVSPNGVTGTWLPAIIDNTTSGSYEFYPDAGQCAVMTTISVTVNQATLQSLTYTVSPAFDDNQVITVIASGPGDYLYQLDYGPLQASPVFQNVMAGSHTITVVDPNGCSAPLTEDEVIVVNYPKYFTPNGDGFHDTWNITGLEDQQAKISIFDRYGKLIKQISTMGAGWDGTYNGNAMPSTDYWFTIEFKELQVKREFKAHFALKR
ncbi:T9SS type B sorting domain-containing protein [Flavobacterium caeni]|uniref:Gliding motility-associated C-terminal domain-containing protein n=1 Tax=Flavobacterium caeni TaxID=490189 RepID=A0A1G5D5J6_9FLAO|nr:T9SS type B sorting domain-containing protein [Flavobacterium caeni]SCY10119.1 gliding motility-associated C-terminal domain-containing protein [Flavobacterium caeni]